MRKALIFTILSVFFLSVVTVQAANTYEFQWLMSNNATDQYNPQFHNFIPSFYSPDVDSCVIEAQTYATIGMNYGPAPMSTTYNCPYDILAGISEKQTPGVIDPVTGLNWTCETQGAVICDEAEGGVYEIKSKITDVWANGWMVPSFSTLVGDYNCSVDNEWLNLPSYERDSEGQYVNTYFWVGGGNCPACSITEAEIQINTSNFNWYVLNGSNFGICDETDSYTIGAYDIDEDDGSGMINFRIYSAINWMVFNSSELGIVRLQLNEPNATMFNNSVNAYSSVVAAIYPLENESNIIQILDTGLINNNDEFYTEDNPIDQTFYLEADTTYVFRLVESAYQSAGENWYYYNHSNFTISVYVHEPDWECSAWSSCTNITRTRTCVDATGTAADRIEHGPCYTAPEETLWLGFGDNFYTQNVWRSFLEWTCGCSIDDKEVRYPSNWQISNPLINYTDYGTTPANVSYGYWDYIKVTDETSADGDAWSLKMWYVPPKALMPVSQQVGDTSTVICGNRTYGGVASVATPVNESIFIETNITFPSPYMNLFFNAKKCAEPEFQYAAPNWFGLEYCGPQACYTHTGNCSESPRARIYVKLYVGNDTNPGETIFENVDEITESATWESREYVIEELDETQNYTLRFFVLPETGSNMDPESYCLYLDNVSFYIRDDELVCSDYCDTNTYGLLHKATLIDGACIHRSVPLSSACVSDDIVDDIAEERDFCDPGCEDSNYRFYRFVNETETWEIIENSENCRLWCEQLHPEDTITSEDLEKIYNALWTPMFVSIFASLAIGAAVGGVTKHMTLGLVSIMILLLGFTMFGFFPAWIFVITIIIAGFLLARGTLGSLKGG